MAELHAVRILADDLSGAAECAAAFAVAAGEAVPVYLQEMGPVTGPCALDTDSRAKDGDAASVAARRAIDWATSGQDRVLVFKKIDSTLRGHIGPELAAALKAYPGFTGVVVSPAFPEQNRELRQGKLYVDGHPFPVSEPADLVALLQEAGLRPVLVDSRRCDEATLRLQIVQAFEGGARAVAVDAGCAEDLARLAMAIDLPAPAHVLMAGSAGLARALANAAAERLPSAHARSRARAARRGPVVAVVGSFSWKSAAQLRSLAAHGRAEIVRCDPDEWLNAMTPGSGADKLQRAERQLAAGRDIVFAIGGEAPSAAEASGSLIKSVAAAVVPLLQHAAALILTGGDTARAVLERLGAQRLDVSGEFEPGISIGEIASMPGMRIFIKAGAYGDESTLRRLFEHLEAEGQSIVNSCGLPEHPRS